MDAGPRAKPCSLSARFVATTLLFVACSEYDLPLEVDTLPLPAARTLTAWRSHSNLTAAFTPIPSGRSQLKKLCPYPRQTPKSSTLP